MQQETFVYCYNNNNRILNIYCLKGNFDFDVQFNTWLLIFPLFHFQVDTQKIGDILGHGEHANCFCTTERDAEKTIPDLDHQVSILIQVNTF